MGVLPQRRAKILQIIDDDEAIVQIELRAVEHLEPPSVTGDGKPIYVIITPRMETAWLRGIDTSNLADGAIAPVGSVLQVTGNKTYATVGGGQKTVFVLEPLDVSAASLMIDRAKKPRRR